MVEVETIVTEELGDRSYVVHDGAVAAVVDPQRDIDRVEDVLARSGLECAAVLETHLHNDYVTGGYALARSRSVPYAVAASDDVAFERRAVADGDVLVFGSLRVAVVATPGHTDGHLAYVVADGSGPPAVFTGGSLLYGSVGRTDLVDRARTDELTRAQYRSVRRLSGLLPPDSALYPTHGFGSFCSSGATSGATASTIGDERVRNGALVTDDEDAFVAALVAGLTAYPAYYARMGPRNRSGPGAADLSPVTPVDRVELARRLAAGEWVVDLRARTAYAKEHLGGTVGIAVGDQFSTYVGWLLPDGAALTLLAESDADVRSAQRQLTRIGIDRPDGAAVGPPGGLAAGGPLRSYPTTTFAALAAVPGAYVLDVRRDDERSAGAIAGSVHVPLHELPGRIGELDERTVFVHCAMGTRAAIAASLLDRAGRSVVLVDDDFTRAGAALEVERPRR